MFLSFLILRGDVVEKKTYESPTVEVIEFFMEDAISAST